MKLGLLVVSLMMMVSAWADPQDIPTLPPASQDFLREAGWHSATAEGDEWAAWTKDQARLVWKPWTPTTDGVRWRLGDEKARYWPSDNGATLGCRNF